MKILNFKLALILSLLTLISQNGIAHTEKVICRIKEIPCMHDGVFIPGTNEYNPNLSLGFFYVETDTEVIK